MQDVQSKNISIGIKKLNIFLKNELTEKIFELSTNTENKDYFILLGRLERSIEQFIKRDSNLFYIGLLGHYSSGKSSTINSLLNLKGKKEERNVSLNPTDDQITLITDKKNIEQVVKLIRVGHVPVVISHLEGFDFLLDKVLMDTPGSGDPSVFEEIVRDSLPLCDLIIYCISATNPLDNSDIPLLIEKEKNLSKIPTLFVITRGNEFKTNMNVPLSENNFNLFESKKTLTQLASRIKSVVDTIDLNYEDFIIIDNKENYNIIKLDNEIKAILDPDNKTNITNLYGHKLEFYQRTFQSIKGHFTKTIVDNFNTINSFVSKAQKNIEDYNQKTQIGNDKLIVEWHNIDDRIKTVLDGSINENNKVTLSLNSPLNILSNESLKELFKKSISNFSTNNETIVIDIFSKISSRIDDCKGILIHELYNTEEKKKNTNKEELNNKLNSNFQNLKSIEIKSKFSFVDFYNDFYSKITKSEGLNRYDSFKRNFDSVLNRIRNKNPLENVTKQIETAKNILSEIFQTYSEAVKIYRIAAFSSEAKSYIRKLGLSDQLDNLDSINMDINIHLNSAETQMFKSFRDAEIEFRTQCNNIEELINKIKLDYPILNTPQNSDLIGNMVDSFEGNATRKVDEILEEIRIKVIDFFMKKIDEINLRIYSLNIEKENSVDLLKKKRIKDYIFWLLPSLLVLILTIFLFKILPGLNINTNNLSIGWQWIFGIATNCAFTVLNILFIKSKDKFIENKNDVTNKFNVHEKQIILEEIEKEYSNFKDELINKSKIEILNYLNDQNKKDLEKLTSRINNKLEYEFYDLIVSNEISLKSSITNYSHSLTSLKKVITESLNDIKKIRLILQEESRKIKENSINPSFELLFSTQENISKVQIQIAEINI